MSSNKHKIPAFTVMELLISMIAAALVIGIAYAALNIITKSYRTFVRKHDDLAVILQLDELIRKDITKCDKISSTVNGISLLKDDQNISYEISENYIIRRSVNIDTFTVHIKSFEVKFENAPISDQSFTSSESVDEISFDLAYQKELIPYHYQKLYSAEALFNLNNHAGN